MVAESAVVYVSQETWQPNAKRRASQDVFRVRRHSSCLPPARDAGLDSRSRFSPELTGLACFGFGVLLGGVLLWCFDRR